MCVSVSEGEWLLHFFHNAVLLCMGYVIVIF